MKTGWVYILECSDGTYYTGVTSNLEKRIVEHELGVYDGYTSSRRPVKLRWSEMFPNMSQAIAFEKQVKGWTRKKKEALMKGDFTAVSILSRSTKTKKKLAALSQSSTPSRTK
jgi:predicted GIY-YIG superfamily endonuclease